MTERLIFANVGWMKWYKGPSPDDQIIGGGASVAENESGGEIWNFRPRHGYFYGFIPPSGRVNLSRLGANDEAQYLDDVTVIWTARSRKFGRVIVGWYRHARVSRKPAPGPNDDIFSARAKVKDCRLLEFQPDQRVFPIPKGPGSMGQSNIWYADNPQHQRLRTRVLDYIKHDGARVPMVRVSKASKASVHRWQQDIKRRMAVEEAAMRKAEDYYRDHGFSTKRVHLENLGWDIDATKKGTTLRVEVKGLSGAELSVELTPNEYMAMKQHKSSYHLCVVLNALEKNCQPRVFAYSKMGLWTDEIGPLNCTEVVGATFRA
jgi:hypothetical protein